MTKDDVAVGIRLLYRLDPRAGIILIMGWAFAVALAFMVEPNIQQKESLSFLATFKLPNSFYWSLFLVDFLLLLASLLAIKNWIKATASVMSACVWFLFGVFVVLNTHGAFTILGLFSIFCAIACSLSAAQWAHWD